MTRHRELTPPITTAEVINPTKGATTTVTSATTASTATTNRTTDPATTSARPTTPIDRDTDLHHSMRDRPCPGCEDTATQPPGTLPC